MIQCKDIPDTGVLEFLSRNPTKWHNWFPGDEFDVSQAMPPGIPGKLVHAKMRTLIRRGLVDGCPCGCRGDFVINVKGLEQLRKTTP